MSESGEYIAFLQRLVPEMLQALAAGDARATFFVVARLYEECPDLIHQIREAGHEIGYHSYSHPRLTSTDQLEAELQRSTGFLEEFAPRGFRAPFLYLPEELLGLVESSGFAYDSSTLGAPGDSYERGGLKIFPVTSLPLLGSGPEGPRYPIEISPAMLWREIPVGTGIAASYLRHLYGRLLEGYASRGRSCTFYLHPWQLLPNSETERFSWRSGLRWIHAFPLGEWLEKLAQRVELRRLDSKLTQRDAAPGSGHCLTIDFE